MKVAEAMRPNLVSWLLFGFFLAFGLFLTAIGALFLLFDDDPLVLSLGLGWIVLSLGGFLLLYLMKRRADRAVAVRQTGIPGTATVLEAKATHTSIGPRPGSARVWRVRLRVECGGFEPYEVITRVVPEVGPSGLEPGCVWPVRVDRTNPENVEVDWAGLQATAYTIELGPGIVISSQNPIQFELRTDPPGEEPGQHRQS